MVKVNKYLIVQVGIPDEQLADGNLSLFVDNTDSSALGIVADDFILVIPENMPGWSIGIADLAGQVDHISRPDIGVLSTQDLCSCSY